MTSSTTGSPSRRWFRNRDLWLSVGLILPTVAIALLAPILAAHSPFALVGQPFSPPTSDFRFGTDDLGRDVWSAVLYGSRVSLTVGILAALTSTTIGLAVGAIAGYFGGLTDDALMRITEIFQVVPRFFVAIVVVSLIGSNFWYVILIIGCLSWPETARLVRSVVLSIREQPFTEAAIALGLPKYRVLIVHIVPNALSPVIVSGTIQVARAIILESSLSFLGLGDPTVTSWGGMLGNAQMFLRRAWWMVLFPGIALFITAYSFQMLGDALNRVLNPRSRRK